MSTDRPTDDRPTPGARFVAAASMSLLVYAILTLLAFAPASLARAGWIDAVGHFPPDSGALLQPGGALLLEATQHAARTSGTRTAYAALVTAALMLILSPMLSIAWLAAMTGQPRVRMALRIGIRRYFPAIAVTVLLAARMIVTLILALLPAVALHWTIDVRPDPRPHDIAVAIACLLPLGVVVLWSTALDLARAAVAGRGGITTALVRGLGALRSAVIGAYLLWWAIGTAAAVVGTSIATQFDMTDTVSAIAALALGQLAVFARVLARGRWLAEAAHETERLQLPG